MVPGHNLRTMKHAGIICILVLCFSTVLSAGCTIQHDNPTGPGAGSTVAVTILQTVSPPGGAETTVIIRIKDNSFDSPIITIHPGATVVWVNEDPVAHRVTYTGEGDTRFDSQSIQPGTAFSNTFMEAGRYDYADSTHSNMRGAIIVA